jgi:hypothetical protein
MSDDDEQMVFERMRDYALKHNLPVKFTRHPS